MLFIGVVLLFIVPGVVCGVPTVVVASGTAPPLGLTVPAGEVVVVWAVSDPAVRATATSAGKAA